MKTIKLICVYCMLLPSTLLCQNRIVSLDNYFAEVRKGNNVSIPKEILLVAVHDKVLSALQLYYNDTLPIIRNQAYYISKTIGTTSKSSVIRAQAVTQLLTAAKDSDSGNVGVVLDHLTTFNKSDFSPIAKDSLANLFNIKIPHLPKLIKLIGFVEENRVHSYLQTLSQPGNSKTDRWASLLALARMGDTQATTNIMNRVRKVGINDDVVYEIFPDLIYTHQPEAIAYLIEALNSDEKNCSSADGEREAKIPCAYRVMEMLAPVIKDFPLKVDESGDIDTKDYVAALQTAREWFRENKTYTVLNEQY